MNEQKLLRFLKNFVCRFLGHDWEWWQLINQHKCKRCLEPRDKDEEVFFSRFAFLNKENFYRKIQTPFWKLAGYKPTKEEERQEKWMKDKGLDYYDVQRMRDRAEGARYKKDLTPLKHPTKLAPLEYSKVPMQ